MRRFIQGEHRGQCTLLPESLDNYVADSNPVRVVDVFVDELDLGRVGFGAVVPAETDRPSYHPAVLLKIYNVELMWLTERLTPDFKSAIQIQ